MFAGLGVWDVPEWRMSSSPVWAPLVAFTAPPPCGNAPVSGAGVVVWGVPTIVIIRDTLYFLCLLALHLFCLLALGSHLSAWSVAPSHLGQDRAIGFVLGVAVSVS